MKICNLASGSKGNCTYIESKSTSILIDEGLCVTEFLKRAAIVDIDVKSIKAIVVTHEHTDHVKGVARLAKLLNSKVYMHPKSLFKLKDIPAKIAQVNMDEQFCIDDLCITPFRLPHDSAYNQGYTVCDELASFSIATDLGVANSNVVERLAKSDCVLLESNHDLDLLKKGSYPYVLKQRILSNLGHLSNHDCANVAVELAKGNVKRLILGHLSEDNNTPELAFENTRSALEINNMKEGKDIIVSVASQYKPTRIINL